MGEYVIVAFYLKNGALPNLDASKPEEGNPGIGGRQYMNIMIAHSLSVNEGCSSQVVVYSELPVKLPPKVRSEAVGDILSALRRASEERVDYFITDVSISYHFVDNLLSLAERCQVKLIIRLGLIPSAKILARLSSSKAVLAVICVENQVLELILDHPVAAKSLVIPNGIPWRPFDFSPVRFADRGPTVSYMGSLVPQKGFGRLARAWPIVLRAVPSAKLQVIGSGQLYGESREMGKWGVASEKFENSCIRPFLSDEKGDPHDSVTFLGVLGAEKIEVLKTSKVGIANPVGETETFCISAVEFQAAGTPVVAGAKYGLFDTVLDGETGYLVNNQEELAEKIIFLLENDLEAEKLGVAARFFVRNKYSFDRVVAQWESLLQNLSEGFLIVSPIPESKPKTLGAKIVRVNMHFRKIPGVGNWWPTFLGVCNGVDYLKRSILLLLNRPK